MFDDFFDIFGKGGSRSFYMRDFKNAYRFRPDIDPVRLKFQGYVNFILNRDLYSSLYAGDTASNNSEAQFRTTISSLVKTAELPSMKFNTEVKKAYNNKRIVNTGVEYDPVNITVYDTVGNEWLSLIMKYFSYHYMDPRNKSNENDRDVNAIESRETEFEFLQSAFGFSDEGEGSKFNSNSAGYNTNITPHFFERIDYVLYHGNKGVQYSIINPVLTGFQPSGIDYSDNNYMDFQLSFEYEKFIVYDKVNFSLSEEDIRRFEDARKFTGPAFDADDTLAETTLKERDLGFLGNADKKRLRSAQPTVTEQVSDEPVGSESITVNEEGDPVETQDQPVTTDPDAEQPSGDAVEDAQNQDDADATESEESNVTVSGSALPSTYGSAASFARSTGLSQNTDTFSDILGDVVDSALTAAIHGNNIKDAVVNTAVGGVSTALIRTFTASDVAGNTSSTGGETNSGGS